MSGVPVAYRVVGAGPPTILVHGLGGSWRWWLPVVEPLAASLRLYLVDLPGFGSSRRRSFVLADAPSYLRALVESLEVERAHLVGHSLGGVVCARVAAIWPEVVDRLVLAAPAGFLDRRHPARYALPLAAALRHLQPRFLRMLAGDALRAGAVTLTRAASDLLGDDGARDELGSIAAPTLLVWGSRDTLVPLPTAVDYERAIKDARLVTLAGAGHVPMLERPAEFADAVVRFLLAE